MVIMILYSVIMTTLRCYHDNFITKVSVCIFLISWPCNLWTIDVTTNQYPIICTFRIRDKRLAKEEGGRLYLPAGRTIIWNRWARVWCRNTLHIDTDINGGTFIICHRFISNFRQCPPPVQDRLFYVAYYYYSRVTIFTSNHMRSALFLVF
jgi:hypothetical protein